MELPEITSRANTQRPKAVSILASTSTDGILQPQTEISTPSELPQPPIQPRYSTGRKVWILATVSWTSIAATFSSTSLFPATPEIAEAYGTTTNVINITNAGVLICMGFASFFWIPIGDVFGRKLSYLSAIAVFSIFSIGATFAPNLATFVVTRILAGFEATFFMVAGQAYLTDIWEPETRGTAVGFFMCGTTIGPALGPCFGGIIVTFTNWRVIFGLQAAMACAGLISAIFCIPVVDKPPACNNRNVTVTPGASQGKLAELLSKYNPTNIFRFLIYPNVILTDLACGLLAWNQYALLTPPRYLINPRFNLTTPLVSGLFYLSPGAGFMCGAVCGGKWSDRVVKRHIIRRQGLRIAQDRLNSGIVGFWLLFPGATLVYGWGLQFKAGGLVLPVVAAFFSGAGLMVAFNSLNTYSAEVMPSNKREVMAGKYFIQYFFAAAGNAAILNLIDAAGIGPTSTISAAMAFIAGILAIVTARYGLRMQEKVESMYKRK